MREMAVVLFSDLVGSTALRVGQGATAADQLVARHDAILRQA